MFTLRLFNQIIWECQVGKGLGRSPSSTSNFLPDRMWTKVRGWSDWALSRVGKEVMLNSVIQAIPVYIMSCFQLPVAVYNKMRTTITGGVLKMVRRKCTGAHGSGWQPLKLWEEWDFEIFNSSTKQCWARNFRKFLLNLIHFVLEYSKGATSLNAHSWMRPDIEVHLSHGAALCMVSKAVLANPEALCETMNWGPSGLVCKHARLLRPVSA